ncbi:MAG: Expression activator-related protein [Ferruginibacter sp.]|jgi:hypothetical protein|uniref:BLUF domain-containing protein n=1 Tax=Ferruginibacter sp. TaxID=1940288 RepID=UPI0026585E41|nr:BLUF domain-containing protein [Ferruginibacter sp.]MDB5276545.1 Expression activator-related protein [Ferruginibacter sp.]
MYQLIYCSIASPGLHPADIKAILNTSRNFNSANGITGCLIYYNDEFIQILEGKKLTVKKMYEKIEHDGRHFSVIMMSEEEADERIFSNWAMAYCGFNGEANGRRNFLFEQNLIALSELAEKPTQTIKLFFHLTKLMLEGELNDRAKKPN